MAGLELVEAIGTPPPVGLAASHGPNRPEFTEPHPTRKVCSHCGEELDEEAPCGGGFGGVMQFACVKCGVTLDAGSVAAQRYRYCGRIFLDPLRGIRRLIKRARAGFAKEVA